MLFTQIIPIAVGRRKKYKYLQEKYLYFPPSSFPNRNFGIFPSLLFFVDYINWKAFKRIKIGIYLMEKNITIRGMGAKSNAGKNLPIFSERTELSEKLKPNAYLSAV